MPVAILNLSLAELQKLLKSDDLLKPVLEDDPLLRTASAQALTTS